jgi:6-phosphogluconolactonase (cycloisomerase 2 family)
MDSAELVINPSIPGILYASNRAELHIAELNKDDKDSKDQPLSELPPVSGDAVAIILLNDKGDDVEEIKHVRTGCDGIRGMQVSKDGKYVAVAGQKGGGVEIYQVGGKRGDEWKLAAKEEKLEQVVDFVWL